MIGCNHTVTRGYTKFVIEVYQLAQVHFVWEQVFQLLLCLFCLIRLRVKLFECFKYLLCSLLIVNSTSLKYSLIFLLTSWKVLLQDLNESNTGLEMWLHVLLLSSIWSILLCQFDQLVLYVILHGLFVFDVFRVEKDLDWSLHHADDQTLPGFSWENCGDLWKCVLYF